MTLGLTSTGAVKIKTDGGLRAVNCACCEEVCGCSKVKLPSHLFETLKNATSATVWGTNSDEFIPSPAPPYDFVLWEMRWHGGPVPDMTDYYYHYGLWLQKNGCLLFVAFYSCPSEAAWYASLLSAGSPDDCVQPEVPFVQGTFSINGAGGFPYYYEPYLYDICDPPGPPNLIIT